MEISRERIIEAITNNFINNPVVYALWLEGADSTHAVDEFSDIDLWLDVEDGREDDIFSQIERLLTEIGPLDFIYQAEHPHPKIRHKVFHLQDTSEFLLLDICIQSHSRKAEESEFVVGDPIESPRVIFDKAAVIRFRPLDKAQLQRQLQARIFHLEHIFARRSGAKKYVMRNEFLEALAYYHRYVLEPLVELLRIRYTPLHYGYGPVHISRHLPQDVVLALEALYKITTMDDVLEGIHKAESLFTETMAAISSLQE
jgi:hypothetical protein